jgi:uncharacterized repeat protein (TIGR02543 family)
LKMRNTRVKAMRPVVFLLCAGILLIGGCKDLFHPEGPTKRPAKPAEFTVTFNAGGGQSAVETRTVTSGKSVGASKMPSDPARDGYIFDGWYTAVNGGGTQFTAATTVTADITVYAKWTVEYTVTFNADEGSPETQTETAASGGSLGSANMPTEPTKSGYTFDGWYTEQNGGGTRFTGTTTVRADITVYAKWTAQYEVPAAPVSAPLISPGNEQLTVTWTEVEGASAYELWLAAVNNSADAEKNGGDISVLTKTVSGLSNGTTYYVWIKAKNDIGISGFSPVASGTPSNTSINIGFNYHEITITGSDGVNGISKSGAAGRPQSLSLNAAGYTAVVWYVDGNTPGITGGETGITLAAVDYPVQTHSITFTGKWDGVLYSQTIPFTVYV